MRPADTSPEAWRQYLQILRRMAPEEKLQRAFELSRLLLDNIEEALRRKYPRASDREIFLRRARLQLGKDDFVKVYGDALDYDGRDDGLVECARRQVDREAIHGLLKRIGPD